VTRKHKIKFGNLHIPMPASRIARIAIGVTLVITGALFGWLPLLGYWMVPLGLLVLSIDIAIARRWRRRMEVEGLPHARRWRDRLRAWWQRRKAAWAGKTH
jgi:hypothetical protein